MKEKNLLWNTRQEKGVLVVSHRGSSSGNVPCNTLAAFNAGLMEGADVIELDVSVSSDGKLYVFHPGMEPAHIMTRKLIRFRKSNSVERLRYVNQDNVKTSYPVYTLEETLNYLKGKCFINIDKFWTAPEQIADCVRKCGVENQVIIKTNCNKKDIDLTEKFAPDLMYMPVIDKKDSVMDDLMNRNINLVGAEVLFETEQDEVCTKTFIDRLHEKGLLVWGNAILYNEDAVISAHHTDDVAVGGDPEKGWGWFVDNGFDIIQTDRAGLVKSYLQGRK